MTRSGPMRSEDEMRPVVSEPAFVALADHAPDAIARLSRVGQLLYVNHAVERLLGRDATLIVGSTVGHLGLPRRVAVRCRRGIRHVFRTGTEAAFDVDVEVDAVSRHFAVRIVPEFDPDRRVASALAVIYDVTQRTMAGRERDDLLVREQAARTRAEAAASARDLFLSIVSHELRSPLNGIQSWSHVLESHLTGPDRANPVAMRAIDGIRAGIEQQVRLIDHLIDATVAMTGQLRLAREPVVVREAIDAAVAAVRTAALAKDIALHVDIGVVEQRIDGDAHRLRQIVGHLLSNALKFTPNGGSVWLTVHVADGAVMVVVRDSGRGLPAGHAHWLFEPFHHADSTNTRRSGGIGLGLALARRLAELHGGHIAASSPGPHLGSTFTVTLPLLAVASDGRTNDVVVARRSKALEGITALVVDDQVEAREALTALLAHFGADVEAAASSRAAMALIERHARLPDIVLCDVAMPEEDGYAFVARLRHHEATRVRSEVRGPAHTPVIALSAFAKPNRADPSGPDFDLYLAKPVDRHQLLAALSGFVGA